MGKNNPKLLCEIRGSQHTVTVQEQDPGAMVHRFMNLQTQFSATVKKANDKFALLCH